MPTVSLRSMSGSNAPDTCYSAAGADQGPLVTSGYCRTRPNAEVAGLEKRTLRTAKIAGP